MPRHAVRSVKMPLPAASIPDKQAAIALDHLQRGRFRDALECYKTLLKIEPRAEWLAGLSSAYEGRAKALAAKDMRREAIAMWRTRAEVCHAPLWEGPYVSWLIAEGQLADVLSHLSTQRAASSDAPQDNPDAGLATLEAKLAPALLSADHATCMQLPADSLLAKHRPHALAALSAYSRMDGPALDEALAGISFRSPYRDLRSVLKAFVLWDTDPDSARIAIERIALDGPFEPLAAPLRSMVVSSGPERWRRWTKLNGSQQLIALDLMGCPRAWASALPILADADPDLAPADLFDLVQRNARVLPEAVATRLWQWLAPWAKRRGCASPVIFGKPSKAVQECTTALAVEIKGELDHAEEHWLDAVELLAASADTDDRLRAAMVLRHMASMKEHLSREGVLDRVGARYLSRSVEFDPSDCDVHVRLVASWRRNGDLKQARECLETGLALFPDSMALLTEAVEAALATGAFKKAATTARRLLELDPLNRKVRALLGNAHLSHAGKQIKAGKFPQAKKEIEEARNWLGSANEQGRLQLLLAWTEPQGSAERLRLARLAVTSWGCDLAAGWRLLREAQGLFVRVELTAANSLLNEAGIDSAKALMPADVLELVQVLEQEPPAARKGADPLMPWRKALVKLAPAPLFDDETTARICEALSRHQEHDLLERFANAGRRRWPDRPLFAYHAIAARYGKNGCIESDRDFDDLERAGERARKSNDFKLASRIEALFDVENDVPDFEDSESMDGLPLMDPQAFRAMLEISVKMDGGKSFLKNARDELGDSIVRQVEKACGGDKKATLSRLIEMVVAQVTGIIGKPTPVASPKAKMPLAVPKTIAMPRQDPPTKGKTPIAPPAKTVISAPDTGQGNLFDE